jgi:hypothetical protein
MPYDYYMLADENRALKRFVTLKLLILLSYLLLSSLTLFVTKESPINIFPYPGYFGVQNPEIEKSNVISREDNSIVNTKPSIQGFDYSEYVALQNNRVFSHSKNYILSSSISKFINKMISSGFISVDYDNILLFGIFVFFVIPIIPFIFLTFCMSNNSYYKIDKIPFIIYIFLFLLGFSRLLFNKGYPESFIGVPQISNFSQIIKGFIGPFLFPQGHIGLWGIEPRNTSMFFGVLSLIFLLSGKPMFKYSFLYILLSLLVSTSQGLLFILPHLVFLILNFKNKLIIYLFCFFSLFILSLIYNMQSDKDLFLPIILLVIFTVILIFRINMFELRFPNMQNYLLIFYFYLIVYIVTLLITLNTQFYLSIDSNIRDSRIIRNSDLLYSTYVLWGRGFIQEYPGRIGTFLLVILLYFIFTFLYNNCIPKHCSRYSFKYSIQTSHITYITVVKLFMMLK